ncbi:MAG: hypothetical protein P8Y18_08425 [Candidatus Bathyarchaeota archaeon]
MNLPLTSLNNGETGVIISTDHSRTGDNSCRNRVRKGCKTLRGSRLAIGRGMASRIFVDVKR